VTELRSAVPADAEALKLLARQAYAHYVPRLNFEPPPMNADFPHLVAAGRVTVAVRDAAIVGYVVLVPEPDHLLIENVAVRPSEQGQGLGRRLLEHAEAQAAGTGLTEVRLYTNEVMVENLAFYARRGYRETHRLEQNGFRRVFLSKQLP
jgi:ribosomal protein S18 acetylase RimI-like enzyme